MRINWLIGTTCHQERKTELKSVIESYGDMVIDYKPFQRIDFIHNELPTISLCSLQQATEITKEQRLRNLKSSKGIISGNLNPGVYCNLNNFKCTVYYPYFNKNLLNYPYCIIPYGDLVNHKDEIFKWFGNNNSVFIRPNSGFKDFTGQVFNYETFEKDIKLCDSVEPNSDCLCLVSEPKNIISEYRLVIVRRKIVGYSRYRLNRRHDESPDCPENILNYAEQTLNSVDFEPDLCYTMDICETTSEIKVLELNSFSCSGFYQCNFETIIPAVRDCVIGEYLENK